MGPHGGRESFRQKQCNPRRSNHKMGLKESWRCFPVTWSLMKNGKGEEREREERGKERKRIWGCERDLYRGSSSETHLYLWSKSPAASLTNPQNTGKFWLSNLPGTARDFLPCDSVHSNVHDKDHGGGKYHKWELKSKHMLLNSAPEKTSGRGPDSSCEVSPKDTYSHKIFIDSLKLLLLKKKTNCF